MKELNEKRLNDELTIVALVLIVMFIMYYLLATYNRSNKLEAKLIEAQKVAIILDKRLTKTEDKLEKNQETIESLQYQIKENEKINAIVKDIATYWYNGEKN